MSRRSETSHERRTQAERTATAARRMIRAATKLIASKGYTKTTMTDVGKEAGYSSGLVSHHFGSKEGLLRDLVESISGRFYTDQIRPATKELSSIDALCGLADTYLGELTVREERMRALYVLMGEALGPVPEINEVFTDLNRGFRVNARAAITNGIEQGEIRDDIDADAEAALFVGILRGVAMQWMTDPECFDLAEVQRSVRDTIRSHLSTRANEA